jgi:hypothetical protein
VIRTRGPGNLKAPWWRRDVTVRGRMQAGIRSRYPGIKVSESAKKLSYELELDVETYETRCVTVVFEAGYLAEGSGFSRMVLRSRPIGTRATSSVCGAKRTRQSSSDSPNMGWLLSSRWRAGTTFGRLGGGRPAGGMVANGSAPRPTPTRRIRKSSTR